MLQNYDSVELVKDENGNLKLSKEWQNKDQSHAQMVRFSKKVNGTYYVVEAVPDSSKKKLHVVSAYMQKKTDDFTQDQHASQSSVDGGSPARLLNIENNGISPQLTPETPTGKATSVNPSVPQNSSAVKNTETANSAKLTGVDGENGFAVGNVPVESVTPKAGKETVRRVLSEQGIPDAVAEGFAQDYDDTGTLSDVAFARAMAEAYHFGEWNIPKAELSTGKGLAPMLTERQRNYAYSHGQNARLTALEAEAAAQKEGTADIAAAVQNKAHVKFEGKISTKNRSAIQKASIEALEHLGKQLGITFYLYESEVDAEGKPVGANGWYDQKTGDIHLDMNAGEFGQGTILYTASHELTHFLRQWSPAKFKILADFLMEKYADKGVSVSELVRRQQEKARRNGRKLSFAEAYEEMIADSMETMLSDGNVIERIAELQAKDKGLAQKIRDWFKSFAAKLRKAYKGMEADTVEGRLVAEMAEEADRLHALFVEGLADAAENYNAAGAQKNTTDEGGVLYSIRRTQNMTWAEQVKGSLYNGGNIRRNDTLVVGSSKDTLVSGVVDHKVLAIPLHVITKAQTGKDISHSIKRGKLAKLDEGIKNARMVIVNPDRKAMVFVTNINQGGMPIVVSFDVDATFDGDPVHKATSIHLQIDMQSMLESLPESASIYLHKKELDPVGATNNLRGLAAKIKFVDTIAHEDSIVKNKVQKQVRDYGSVEEMDTDYMAAVESGDMETAQRMVDETAKKSMPDSKVVDENGDLLLMYHGTSNGGAFAVFDGDKLSNETRTSQIGQGFYFTNAKNEAEAYTKNIDIYGRTSVGRAPHLHQVYLNITNPFDVRKDTLDLDKAKSVYMDGGYDYFYNEWIPFDLDRKSVNGTTYTKAELKAMAKEERVSVYVDWLSRLGNKEVLSNMTRAFHYNKQGELLSSMKNKLGYDGIVEEYKTGKFQYVAFSSEQIKSADPVTYDDNGNVIPLSERFNENKSDIRYSLRSGLKDDLERVKNRTFPSAQGEVEIGNTSDFLVNELDADPLIVTMPATKAYRAIVTEEQAIKDGQPVGEDINYHGLGVDGLYNILERSEEPLAAFVSKPSENGSRFDRIVLVTDVRTGEGLGVAIVEVDTASRIHGKQLRANKTITVYDKSGTLNAVQEAFDEGRLLYIDKKNGHQFDSGRKGSNCPTTISESVRKKNIQDFWANVKWKKTGKKELSFDGGQKDESAFAAAMKNAGKLRSDRGNLTTRSILTELDASTVTNEIERKHLLEYQENSRNHLEQQKKLREAQQKIEKYKAEGKTNKKQLAALRVEETQAKVRMDGYAKRLEKAESGVFLRGVIQREVKSALSKSVETYGAIPAGMNAATDRAVEMPKSMDGKSKVSRVARSAAEAVMTPKEFVPQIEEAVVNGMLSYDPDTNKAQLDRAHKWLEHNGWSDCMREWTRKAAQKNKLTKDDVARGIALYNNLSNRANNAETEEERIERGKDAICVLSDLQNMVTEAAQMIQAMTIMKKQTAEMQYYALECSVKKIEDELSKSLPDGIQLNEELVARWMDAIRSGEEATVDTAAQALYRDIAAQVPRTIWDKWNAWRYLCMLGNAKTIIRNTAGNAAFIPIKAAKDFLGAGIEALAANRGWINQEDRTKTVKVLSATEEGRALLRYAKEDFANVEKLIESNGKYNDSTSVSSELDKAIRDYKNEFQIAGLRHWQKGTNWAMNNQYFGDAAFLKHHYTTAFAHAAAARGYSADQIQSGKISQQQHDQMRAYAIEQARKATFRDTNAVSKAIQKLNFRVKGPGTLLGRIIIDSRLAFKGTPANVFVRSMEYSPVGLLKTILIDSVSLRMGKITATEYIERLSSGLTGAGIFALGMLLHSLGIIVGDGADEDDDRIGRQSYSLEIGDFSMTLDWLSPAAVPLFMGVETHRVFEEENASLIEAFFDSTIASIEPILEMSMLSGIQDMIDTIAYSGEENFIKQLIYGFVFEPFIGYLSQGIPTISSHAANALEKESEMTYVGDIETQMGRNFMRSLVKVAEKIPFVGYRQVPYVDAYGRTQDKGNALERIFNSFINPAYTDTLRITEPDKEIERLETATGEEISPQRPPYTITVPKYNEEGEHVSSEKLRLTGEQFTAYSEQYGQQYAAMVGVLMSSELYQEMSDAEKVEAVKYIDDLANEYGKVSANVGYDATKGMYKKLFGLTEAGVPVAEAYAAKLYHDSLDKDRKLTSNQAAAKFAAWAESKPWTDEQIAAVRNVYGKFWTQTGSDTEKLDSLAGIKGVSYDTALTITEAVGTLKPESGYANVRPIQKWESVVSTDKLTETQKVEALKRYMSTDKQISGLDLCVNAGLTAEQYVKIARARDTFGNADGKWSKTELEAYLRQSSYSSTERKAILEAFG